MAFNISKEHLVQAAFLVASAGATWYIYNNRAGVNDGAAAGTPIEVASPNLPVNSISTQPASVVASDLPGVGVVNLGPPSSVTPEVIYNLGGTTIGPTGGTTIYSPLQGLIGSGASAPSTQCGCCNSPPAQGDAFATFQNMIDTLPPYQPPIFTPAVTAPATSDNQVAGPTVINPFDAGQFQGAGGFGFFS